MKMTFYNQEKIEDLLSKEGFVPRSNTDHFNSYVKEYTQRGLNLFLKFSGEGWQFEGKMAEEFGLNKQLDKDVLSVRQREELGEFVSNLFENRFKAFEILD